MSNSFLDRNSFKSEFAKMKRNAVIKCLQDRMAVRESSRASLEVVKRMKSFVSSLRVLFDRTLRFFAFVKEEHKEDHFCRFSKSFGVSKPFFIVGWHLFSIHSVSRSMPCQKPLSSDKLLGL